MKYVLDTFPGGNLDCILFSCNHLWIVVHYRWNSTRILWQEDSWDFDLFIAAEAYSNSTCCRHPPVYTRDPEFAVYRSEIGPSVRKFVTVFGGSDIWICRKCWTTYIVKPGTKKRNRKSIAHLKKPLSGDYSLTAFGEIGYKMCVWIPLCSTKKYNFIKSMDLIFDRTVQKSISERTKHGRGFQVNCGWEWYKILSAITVNKHKQGRYCGADAWREKHESHNELPGFVSIAAYISIHNCGITCMCLDGG